MPVVLGIPHRRSSTPGTVLLLAVSIVAACAEPSAPASLRHEFPRVEVVPGETDQLCQSWTLGNDEPIYVNAVAMTNLGGFHHSNWFFAPEGTFAGPDGTWTCADRNFDQSVATLVGGVAFAQSTQATDEVLGFADHAAYRIPPHSTIVGNLHLINAGEQVLDTGLVLEIRPIREADAEVLLSPAAFTYGPLAIPPLSRSRFQATCDLEKAFGAPPDFRLYYLLPHYHALGIGMSAAVDMPDGPVQLLDAAGTIGDVKSKKLDPPVSLVGSSHLQFSCDYENPRSETVGWGNARGEMCILVAWTDTPNIISAGAAFEAESTYVGTSDGVKVYEAPCSVTVVPDRR